MCDVRRGAGKVPEGKSRQHLHAWIFNNDSLALQAMARCHEHECCGKCVLDRSESGVWGV